MAVSPFGDEIGARAAKIDTSAEMCLEGTSEIWTRELSFDRWAPYN